MKRLAIFCDGTWNRLDSPHPTNVVLGTEAVLQRASDDTLQITHYHEGVGTSHLVSRRLSAFVAGAFGLGLFDKVADAYRFIVLNYEVGDEIYIFGFSRGAFTARSLAGLIRNCGILSRNHIEKVPRALAFYRGRTPDMHPDSENAMRFRRRHSPCTIINEEERNWRKRESPGSEDNERAIFQIRYLGVWDTVGALGIPKYIILERVLGTAKKSQFHDLELSTSVSSARHAVAIDETRRSFEPTLWTNLDQLNENGSNTDSYQQLWFPGDHGSVGGGGDLSGLSNGALLWILEGAERCGLELDPKQIDLWRSKTDPMAPLRNRTQPAGFYDRISRKAPRQGPRHWKDLSESAQTRLRSGSKSADMPPYRPKSLEAIMRDLEDHRLTQ